MRPEVNSNRFEMLFRLHSVPFRFRLVAKHMRTS